MNRSGGCNNLRNSQKRIFGCLYLLRKDCASDADLAGSFWDPGGNCGPPIAPNQCGSIKPVHIRMVSRNLKFASRHCDWYHVMLKQFNYPSIVFKVAVHRFDVMSLRTFGSAWGWTIITSVDSFRFSILFFDYEWCPFGRIALGLIERMGIGSSIFHQLFVGFWHPKTSWVA